MPGFNGSGPTGAGPMTGGARGRCNPLNTGFGKYPAGSPGFGGGMGCGRGFREGYGSLRRMHGFGGGFAPYPSFATPPTTTKELNALKLQADSLKNTLDVINARIVDLAKTDS